MVSMETTACLIILSFNYIICRLRVPIFMILNQFLQSYNKKFQGSGFLKHSVVLQLITSSKHLGQQEVMLSMS